jgi:hypothetical protein
VKSLWAWLLPDTDDALLRGRARLVIATCLGLIVAVAAIVLFWLFTGDLWIGTAILGLVLAVILAGIAGLARSGRARLAAWLLIALLFIIVTLDVSGFGLGSPTCAGYFVPTVLAACGLGLGAGVGVALAGSTFLWIIAWGASTGWLEPMIPFEISHLTFNAPAYTVLLLLVALITGFWSRHVNVALQRDTDNAE